MHSIAIIHGYGHMTDNTFSKLYTSKLIKHLESQKYDTLICSGGFTDAKVHQSEAQSIKEKLSEKLNFQGIWLLEEKSFTTYENILECKKLLPSGENKNITVFCWNTHLPKIVYHSLQSYLGLEKKQVLILIQNLRTKYPLPQLTGDILVKILNIEFIGFDLDTQPSHYGKALWSSILETHYDEFPDLHDEFVAFRKKLWKIS